LNHTLHKPALRLSAGFLLPFFDDDESFGFLLGSSLKRVHALSAATPGATLTTTAPFSRRVNTSKLFFHQNNYQS
jgi:hypothetical protein